jgi:hypothetical protein
VTQLYEAAVQKVTSAAAGPIATFVAGSAARPDIREISITLASAPTAGPSVGIGRPAGLGSGTLTGALGQATDVNDPAGTSTLVSAFGTTQPTAPAVPMRRISLPNAIGAGVIWTWDRQDLNVAPSGNLVIWQFTALAVTYDIYIKFEE